jgi:hypothetical protein
MKTKNFVAIIMVAIGLFISAGLFAITNPGTVDGPDNGKVGTGSVSGVYVPD